MHIAMVSWLRGKPVPPVGYGGIERVVHTLTHTLVEQGHRVTLIAPPGSNVPGAELFSTNNFDEAYEFIQGLGADVVHSHECWALESVVRRGLKTPFICTTHVMHAIGWSWNMVYLSASQRDGHYLQLGRPVSKGLLAPVVRVPTSPFLKPQGLPRSDYLLFLGSVLPHKGVREAAQVAALLGRRLVVAGPWADPDYATEVADMSYVEMVGGVQDPYRSALLEQAYAVMCLHNGKSGWLEPGCGVVGEAGAFNTPVAAFPNGCLPEIVLDYDNGWLANTVDELAVKMMFPLTEPGRLAQTEWNATFITHQYVNLYQRAIDGVTW